MRYSTSIIFYVKIKFAEFEGGAFCIDKKTFKDLKKSFLKEWSRIDAVYINSLFHFYCSVVVEISSILGSAFFSGVSFGKDAGLTELAFIISFSAFSCEEAECSVFDLSK